MPNQNTQGLKLLLMAAENLLKDVSHELTTEMPPWSQTHERKLRELRTRSDEWLQALREHREASKLEQTFYWPNERPCAVCGKNEEHHLNPKTRPRHPYSPREKP
jgi:hypothetical protein